MRLKTLTIEEFMRRAIKGAPVSVCLTDRPIRYGAGEHAFNVRYTYLEVRGILRLPPLKRFETKPRLVYYERCFGATDEIELDKEKAQKVNEALQELKSLLAKEGFDVADALWEEEEGDAKKETDARVWTLG